MAAESRGDQPGGHHRGPGLRRRRQSASGFDPDTGTKSVTSLPQAITKGDLSFRTTKPGVDGGVLLGSRLASRLSVYPGDIVTLVPVTQAKMNPALGVAVPRFWKFEVTGLFDTGMFQYDNQFVVMSREMAQRFTGLGDAVSGIAVRVDDPSALRRSVRLWRSGWAIPIARWTGRPRTRASSARSSWKSSPWG